MTMDLDFRDQKESPSPFRYNIKSSIGNGPKMTLGSRTSYQSCAANRVSPDPGTYHIKSTIGASQMAITMGSRPRGFEQNFNNPGPGAYSPQRSKPQNICSLGSRIPIPKSREKSPDFYSIPTTIGQGKQMTLGSRNNFNYFAAINRDTVNVGPGSHSPVFRQQCTQITLKSRPRDITQQNQSPGPGTYYKIESPVKKLPKITLAGRSEKRGVVILDGDDKK